MPQLISIRPITALIVIFVGCVVASAQTPESRSAVPSPEKQTEILAQLDESLGLSSLKTKADKEQAVAKLLELADQADESPDDLYVSLKTAIPLIRETGDFAAHQKAVQKFTETFSADPLQEQTQLLLLFINACKSKESLIPAVEELAALAVDEGQSNQFDKPLEWLAAAEKMAKKSNDKASGAVIAGTRLGLTQRKEAFTAHEKALKTLEADPEDAPANHAEGIWLAIFRDDWDAALPLLAKSSDTKWQAAAQAELAAEEAVDTQLKVADAWYEVAKAPGPAQSVVRQRALDLYTNFEPEVTSPITKTRVTKRKEELTMILNAEVVGTPTPVMKSTTKSVRRPLGENVLPLGESIDLLALVNLPDHAVSGSWKRLDDGIVGQAFPQQRFMTPVVVVGNYELSCKFTRRTGNGDVSLMFPVGDRGCLIVCMDNVCGLHLVNGKAAWDLKANPAAIGRNGLLTNGVTYELQVAVHQEDQKVAVQSSLNWQRLLSWSGQASQLLYEGFHSLPSLHAIGFHSFNSTVDVHELKMKIGRGGRGFRLGDDWKDPLFGVTDQPSSDVVRKCLDWNGKKYFISDKPLQLPQAQLLATQLKGRMLTISSSEEEQFILKQGRGLRLWTSAWCPSNRSSWRDERNRKVRYLGLFGRNQPDNWGGNETQLAVQTNSPTPWDDAVPFHTQIHACIEWGEEYPDGP